MSNKGWIGIDFDGTLAIYHGWKGAATVPDSVPLMVQRVREFIHQGMEVRIFTARIYPLNTCVMPDTKRELHGTFLDNSREDDCWASIEMIRGFCKDHLGKILPITNVKDFGMIELFDDRCIQIEPNTGQLAMDKYYLLGVKDGKGEPK